MSGPLLAGDDLYQLVLVLLAVVAFSAVLVAANFGERYRSMRVVAYAGMCGLSAILALLALSNVAVLALPNHPATTVPPTRYVVGNLLWFAGDLAGLLLLLPAVRGALARVVPQFRADSPVNAVGAAMYVVIAMTFISLQVSTDQLAAIKASGQSPSLFFIIGTNQFPMLVVSLVGVGIFVRRTPMQALARLGLYWPGWRWVLGSAGIAVLLVIFGIGFDFLIRYLTPGQATEIDKVSQQLLSNVTTPAAAVALALAAGIGEETLLRGAVQPRLGIFAAAFLFAVLHTQYAVSLATLEIFILGMALGWLRNKAGVTGTIIAHAGYDLILLMIPFIFHK